LHAPIGIWVMRIITPPPYTPFNIVPVCATKRMSYKIRGFMVAQCFVNSVPVGASWCQRQNHVLT
jgi:hypothetical protein